MKLIIDIHKIFYERAKQGDLVAYYPIIHAIKNGVVLPKNHGRLIDADALLKDVRDNSESYFADDFAHEWVNVAPTIIEADKMES